VSPPDKREGLPVKICITVEADEHLVARITNLVERIIDARPQPPPPPKPTPRFEDIPPAVAILSPTPHRFRRYK
jgi:hypothetical protein